MKRGLNVKSEVWLMICQGLLMCRRLFQLHPPQQSHKLKRQWAREQLQRHLLRSACVGTGTAGKHWKKKICRFKHERTKDIYGQMAWHGMTVMNPSLIFVSILSIIESLRNMSLHVEQLSSEGSPGCLGYIGDYRTVPSYVGIMMNHYMDPYEPISIMESKSVLFV